MTFFLLLKYCLSTKIGSKYFQVPTYVLNTYVPHFMCKLKVLLPLLLTTFYIVKSGLARNEIKWAYKRTIYYLVISFPYPMALQSVTRLLVTIAIYLQLQKMSLRRSSVKTVYLRHSETNVNTRDKHQIPQSPDTTSHQTFIYYTAFIHCT